MLDLLMSGIVIAMAGVFTGLVIWSSRVVGERRNDQ